MVDFLRLGHILVAEMYNNFSVMCQEVVKWPIGDLLLFQPCRPSCSDFMGCLQEYQANEDRQLSPTTLTRLQTKYKRSVRSSHDPFKKAVYCVVGRCNVEDHHSRVIVKTEDYMWLKVVIVGFSFYTTVTYMT